MHDSSIFITTADQRQRGGGAVEDELGRFVGSIDRGPFQLFFKWPGAQDMSNFASQSNDFHIM
jgi:hypothetical protein